MSIKPPAELLIDEIDFDDFLLYIEAFSDYVLLTQKKIDDDVKRKLFLTVAGLRVRKVAQGLDLKDNTFDSLIDGLKKHLKPVKNIILERHILYKMTRNANEDLSTFLVRLRRQASFCNFADTEIDSIDNQMVRDIFIKGLCNAKLTENILSCGNLNLADTISKAEALEHATIDSNFLSENKQPILSVNDSGNQSNNWRNRSKSREKKIGVF